MEEEEKGEKGGEGDSEAGIEEQQDVLLRLQIE